MVWPLLPSVTRTAVWYISITWWPTQEHECIVLSSKIIASKSKPLPDQAKWNVSVLPELLKLPSTFVNNSFNNYDKKVKEDKSTLNNISRNLSYKTLLVLLWHTTEMRAATASHTLTQILSMGRLYFSSLTTNTCNNNSGQMWNIDDIVKPVIVMSKSMLDWLVNCNWNLHINYNY